MTGSPCFLFKDARDSFPSGIILKLILGKGKITVEGSSTDYFCIIASNDELNEDIPFFFWTNNEDIPGSTVLYTN